MTCRAILLVCLLSVFSATHAAVDTEVIVFEIAKDANGSVLGWVQNTWSRDAWNAYGNIGVLERLKEKYDGTEIYSIKIISAGSRYIVYTTTKKNGEKGLGISSTKDLDYFKSEQVRIKAFVEKYPGRHEIRELNGFNERKELYLSFVETPGDIEQLPSILKSSETKEGTFACEGDSGVGQYNVKEYKEGVFVFRGEKQGSTTMVDARDWLATGLSDEEREKKWKAAADRSMRTVCAGMKRGSSIIKAVTGGMKTYFEESWQEKLKECEEGKRPEKDCVIEESTPAATGKRW